MRIQSAMLCEAGSVDNGKLYILGASIATWWLPAFPGYATPVLAAVIEADRDLDQGQAHFSVSVTAAGGGELARADAVVSIQGDMAPGVPWVIPLLTQLQIPAAAAGPVDVCIATDAGIEARIPLMIMARPQPA
jgi:hypothetical protein